MDGTFLKITPGSDALKVLTGGGDILEKIDKLGLPFVAPPDVWDFGKKKLSGGEDGDSG